MPIPPLPIEVVHLILSSAAASLPEVERREECIKFALVCRAWKEIAVRLAWEKVSLWMAGKLLDSAARLPHRDPSPRRAHAAAQMAKLLSLAGTLQVLFLPDVSSPSMKMLLLSTAARAKFASHLRELFVFCFIGRRQDVGYLGPDFAEFSSLRTLGFWVGLFDDSGAEDSLTSTRPAHAVPLKNLFLHVIEGVKQSAALLTHAVLDTLDPSTLTECTLKGRHDDMVAIEWLARCPQLRKLEIYLDQLTLQPDHLTALCRRLPTFQALQELAVFPPTYSSDFVLLPGLLADEQATISLQQFLKSLPSTARDVQVFNLYFSNAAGFRRMDYDELLGMPHDLAFEGIMKLPDEDSTLTAGDSLRYRFVRCIRTRIAGCEPEWLLSAKNTPEMTESGDEYL
ncbi:hypothetical protein NBRC10513_002090 [Rhodotorula toruloides]